MDVSIQSCHKNKVLQNILEHQFILYFLLVKDFEEGEVRGPLEKNTFELLSAVKKLNLKLEHLNFTFYLDYSQGPPKLRPFDSEKFLESVEHSGPQLTCGIKGDWESLYRYSF